jgi:hypothetical protein
MDEPIYKCWETHQEDLTARVEACLESKGGVRVTTLPENADTLRKNTCIVVCSLGHENVFYLED